jgi:hypothetical protein
MNERRTMKVAAATKLQIPAVVPRAPPEKLGGRRRSFSRRDLITWAKAPVFPW